MIQPTTARVFPASRRHSAFSGVHARPCDVHRRLVGLRHPRTLVAVWRFRYGRRRPFTR